MAPVVESIIDFVTSNLVIRDLSLTQSDVNGTGQLTDPNASFHQEIACYSLPYGALGFVSHVLTYYTMFCLWFGRKPLWPFRPVSYTRIDIVLGVVSLIVSTTMAIITLVRCRRSWQLLTIGVWKLTISLVNSCTSITVAHIVAGGGTKTRDTAYWLLLYIPGMISGMTGLISLVSHHWYIPAFKYLSYALAGVLGVIFTGSRMYFDDKPREVIVSTTTFSFVAFMFLAAFYSDWALGLMTGNLVGTPSKDASAFYWTYWVAKRLTMFSI
ncbi:hypothetical protein BDN72DRAFT_815575 [Pluteus cervinus]|uniref:Uncharacterized protein n=1 Tax=Pluteus cervinus TaxID=181527 RepID=A0ACD3B4N2_9AGAR|nr:hypothetical protein BDN72DRAFT_815575 [Pluteus cervinus]